MSKQITIYLPNNGEQSDLKERITVLKGNRSLPYYGRSESAIALMLLAERLDELAEKKTAIS
jgi:hypothetical protein